jgi:hypothetical protein
MSISADVLTRSSCLGFAFTSKELSLELWGVSPILCLEPVVISVDWTVGRGSSPSAKTSPAFVLLRLFCRGTIFAHRCGFLVASVVSSVPTKPSATKHEPARAPRLGFRRGVRLFGLKIAAWTRLTEKESWDLVAHPAMAPVDWFARRLDRLVEHWRESETYDSVTLEDIYLFLNGPGQLAVVNRVKICDRNSESTAYILSFLSECETAIAQQPRRSRTLGLGRPSDVVVRTKARPVVGSCLFRVSIAFGGLLGLVLIFQACTARSSVKACKMACAVVRCSWSLPSLLEPTLKCLPEYGYTCSRIGVGEHVTLKSVSWAEGTSDSASVSSPGVRLLVEIGRSSSLSSRQSGSCNAESSCEVCSSGTRRLKRDGRDGMPFSTTWRKAVRRRRPSQKLASSGMISEASVS